MILFLISIVAGVLTVLAPCTISLLPVIVGGAVGVEPGTGRKRALVVTASLGVSVIAFTLLLKVSTALINVPQSFWQIASGAIILALGFITLFPGIWEGIPLIGRLNRGSNQLLATGYQKKNVIGDVLMGVALGPVFSSCSPTYFLILATVLPQSVTVGIVYLLAYTAGLCGTLLVISVAGQKLVEKFGIASDPNGVLKRSIGGLFILLGLAIMFGYDKKLELIVANNIFDVTKIEQQLLQTDAGVPMPTTLAGSMPLSKPSPNATEQATSTPSNVTNAARIAAKALKYARAPEIKSPSGYVNTDGKPITIGEFRGKKVVLIDFWTYSCINCQRTLPYLKAWYDKYKDQGLEIIGIHTPEFAFEHVQSNVEKAVADFGLKYPSVLDNDYGTWSAFGNQFWPRKYLIDLDGFIVYDHAGEGNYAETEGAIQKALMERASILGTPENISGTVNPSDVIAVDSGKVKSPEIYFGSGRNEYLGNGIVGRSGTQNLINPSSNQPNTLYLAGVWNFSSEYAESKSAGTITFTYNAKDVYFVASAASGVKVKLTLDGKPIGIFGGADVAPDGTVVITENRLYKLVHGAEYGVHTLQIEVMGAGLDAYTFTFG